MIIRVVSCIVLLLSAAVTTMVSAQTKIVTFGDSITSGVKQDAARTVIVCLANGGRFTPPYVCNGNGVKNKGGYQPIASYRFALQGTPADLYNWGFAGQESDQLLGRVNIVMAARSSQYVFIMVGVNDVNDFGYSTATTVFNISRIIDRVVDQGRIPILGTVTPRTSNSTYNARVQQINVGIKAYANSISVQIADHYAKLIGNWSAMHSGDKLHLRTAGNTVVAREWVAAVNRYVAAEAARKARAALSASSLLLE